MSVSRFTRWVACTSSMVAGLRRPGHDTASDSSVLVVKSGCMRCGSLRNRMRRVAHRHPRGLSVPRSGPRRPGRCASGTSLRRTARPRSSRPCADTPGPGCSRSACPHAPGRAARPRGSAPFPPWDATAGKAVNYVQTANLCLRAPWGGNNNNGGCHTTLSTS